MSQVTWWNGSRGRSPVSFWTAVAPWLLGRKLEACIVPVRIINHLLVTADIRARHPRLFHCEVPVLAYRALQLCRQRSKSILKPTQGASQLLGLQYGNVCIKAKHHMLLFSSLTFAVLWSFENIFYHTAIFCLLFEACLFLNFSFWQNIQTIYGKWQQHKCWLSESSS